MMDSALRIFVMNDQSILAIFENNLLRYDLVRHNLKSKRFCILQYARGVRLKTSNRVSHICNLTKI